MSLRSITISAAVSYLSQKIWPEKAEPPKKVTTESDGDFTARQERFLNWGDMNPGAPPKEWRNE